MAEVPKIFDKKQRARQRQRAKAGFTQADFLFRRAGEQLLDRLDDITRTFPTAIDLTSHSGVLREMLAGRGGIETLIETDIIPPAAIMCDEELLPFAPASIDLIMSNLSLHHVNDIPGALTQMQRSLKPDGLLLATLFGGHTLHELRESFTAVEMEMSGGATPHISPFVDVRDAGNLLGRAGFALPVADSEMLTVTYENAFALMHDLRQMGEGNLLADRRKTCTSRQLFLSVAEHYQQHSSDAEGRISATFELVTLTAWAPHTNQQKPAKRGSGKVHFGEVL